MTSATERFCDVVHRVAVVERRRPLKVLAHELGLKYATLYARVIGRVPFSPEEVNSLLRELPDRRLADCLLQGTPFIAVESPSADPAGAGGELKRSVARMRAAADALAKVETRVEGGVDEDALVRGLLTDVNQAEAALAALREALAPRTTQDRRRPKLQEPQRSSAA